MIVTAKKAKKKMINLSSRVKFTNQNYGNYRKITALWQHNGIMETLRIEGQNP